VRWLPGLAYLIEHGCNLMKDIPSPLQQGNGNVGLGMKYLTQLVQGDAAKKDGMWMGSPA